VFNNAYRNQANVVTNGFSTSGKLTGWTVGFGAEFDLGRNWSAKAEHDYIDFGSRTALASDGTTVLRTVNGQRGQGGRELSLRLRTLSGQIFYLLSAWTLEAPVVPGLLSSVVR
jgi:hypothetical protein